MLPPVFLVVPPQIGLLAGFANGLISLANFLRQELPSVHLELVDLSTALDDEVQAAARWVGSQASIPPIVGITTTTASYQSALRAARAFRRQRRDTLIVFGGHHASAQADVILDSHAGLVDVVVHGEGEIALSKLVTEYPRLWSVPGISFVDEAGDVRRTKPAPLLTPDELDHIAVTFDGIGVCSVPGKFDHVTYVSARGCPLRCAFCSVANQAIRAKSIHTVVEDIRQLVGQLGYKRVAIEDNFFAHSRKRTIELCDALAELRNEMAFTWDCQTRVESMDRTGIIPAMEKAGCEAVYLGVEALCHDHLLYLAKTRNPLRYLDALQARVVPALLDSEIDCYINLQFGLPGETEHHRRETLMRLNAIGVMASNKGREITVFPQLHVVYPGTQHFHDAVSEGRFGPSGYRIFETFTRWEDEQKPILRWLGEHFAHGVGGIPEGILSPNKLRSGQFEVDVDRVLEVNAYLRDVERLEGISLFKYGSYLASTEYVVHTKFVSDGSVEV